MARTHTGAAPRLKPQQVERIRQLHSQGVSIPAIAERLGIHRMTVRARLKQAGV